MSGDDPCLETLREAVAKVRNAHAVTRVAERELLLLTGWEEQATYHDVTWWYREGDGCSNDQATAIRYTLQDIKRGRIDARREQAEGSQGS